MRRVGILGGMGPQATILLMQKVVDGIAAADDADHVPLLVDQNPQVPSRIRHLIESTGDDPGPVLVGMARRLV
ncbi:MAG: aspartate racemase, partial [Tabrizicola sp.]|nr:aspartate racemase [Tabrizicola sp.]